LFERSTLDQGALLSVRGRQERYQAFSSEIKAEQRTVMAGVCALKWQRASHLRLNASGQNGPLPNSTQAQAVKTGQYRLFRSWLYNPPNDQRVTFVLVLRRFGEPAALFRTLAVLFRGRHVARH
jgi:hypothetical protein